MATTFEFVTAWALSALDPSVQHGGTRPAGTPNNAADGKEWQREQVTIELYRTGVGWKSFVPRLGEVSVGSIIKWTGGNDNLTAAFKNHYTCMHNAILPAEPGFWIEQITWVWSGAWAEVTIES